TGAADPACTTGDRDGRSVLVSQVSQVDVLASLALFDALQIGVVLPLAATKAVPHPDSSAPGSPQSHAGLGDLQLSLTAALLRRELPFAFTLAMTLPTASDDTWSGA